jgi:hypothetical protein
VLKHRYSLVEKWAKVINEAEGGLDKFSKVELASFTLGIMEWAITDSYTFLPEL